MLKYNIVTTLMNYLPLLLVLLIIHKTASSNIKLITKLFIITNSLLYFYVQWRWIVFDFEASAALETLWACAEIGLMASILLLIKDEMI